MHQLVALVKAKLVPANGAFAALTGICFGNLSLELVRDQWVYYEPNRLDPWMGDLRRVCEEADVELHDEMRTIEGLSQYAYFCRLCRRCETVVTALDSAPVIPEEEE